MDDGLISIERSGDITNTPNGGGEGAVGVSGRSRRARVRPAPQREPANSGWTPQPIRESDFIRVPSPLRRKLRALEAELTDTRAIIAIHPDPILLVDGRGDIIHTNDATETLFGDRLIGSALSAAVNAPSVIDATERVLRGGRTDMVDFALKGSIERHFRCRINPLPDDAGARAALLTITDFTEVKRAEKARADFVANASHELRTPLAILMGFIETLTGPAADDPEAQQRFLPIMHQQATRMARLVDDLLSLSRIELTEHAPPTGKVRLAGLLRSVGQALRLRAAERGMRIEFEIERNLPAIIGDADELSQVFQNLIDNAIKYAAPDTPIVVTAVRSVETPAEVAISVRDRGAGIERRHLPRLTERFYRADTARSCSAGGTGLGLAIVKHVLTRHRGRLEIDSRLGEGSTFTVYLCTAAHGQAAILTPAPQEPDSIPSPPDKTCPDRRHSHLDGRRRPVNRDNSFSRRSGGPPASGKRKAR